MAVSVLNSFIDTNTLLAISYEPDGLAAVANLFQMISLAIHDPEGCVRLNPNSNMDPESFAKYSNCTVDMIKQSIETLQNYDLITIEDGKIYVTLLRKQKMKKSAELQKEAKAAEQRAKGAARTAASRANKKNQKNEETSAENVTKTVTENDNELSLENLIELSSENFNEPSSENYDEPSSENYEKPLEKISESRAPSGVTKAKKKTCNAKCNAFPENGNSHNYNNYNLLIKDKNNYNYNYPNYENCNYADAGKNEWPVTDKGSPHLPAAAQNNLPALAEETGGSCLPFCPGDYVDESKLLPLDKLAPSARNVMEAWNSLQLKYYKGLYAPIVEKLYDILYEYGTENFIKAIDNIKNSPYLMGRNDTPNHWQATLTWLLKPENFLNVLNGKYNRHNEAGAGYNTPRNTFSYCLPGCENRTDITPEERKQAYYEYMHPHNELLDGMARDFGVSY